MPDLLLELFSEEIPARMQPRAADDLRKLVTDGLVDAGLTYDGARAFATPRRLALNVVGIPASSPATREERRGPRVGAPEKAVEGFLRGAGLASIDKARIESDPKKGDFYVAVIERPGRPAADVIAEIVPAAVRGFPWPKSMRWGAGELRWVRPLHSMLCVFGPETEETDVVAFEIDGLASGRTTFGHRFMAPEAIEVRRFADYEKRLEEAKVILDPARRGDIIRTDARTLAFAQGLELVEDEALLGEVAGLVEWPIVLMGEFDPGFLALPPEVVRLTIRNNQKCFVLRDQASRALSNRFVLVANIEAEDGGKRIVTGNERVIAARLSDARFFWEQDRKDKLEKHARKLEHITFHEKLGTQAERVERIARLARELAPICGADPDKAAAAARLAKADLVTGMVGEFPELQGVMGRYYALAEGLDAEIADAIRDHYRPLGQGDDVPMAPVSVAVALADKLDMLVGFWAIDEKPTGSKDPYALRRAALGVIRIVLENGLRIRLSEIYTSALLTYIEMLDPNVISDPPKIFPYKEISFYEWHEVAHESLSSTLLNFDGVMDAPMEAIEQIDTIDRNHDAIKNIVPIIIGRAESIYGYLSARRLAAGQSPDVNQEDVQLAQNALPVLQRAVQPALNEFCRKRLEFDADRLKVQLREEGARHDLVDAVFALGERRTPAPSPLAGEVGPQARVGGTHPAAGRTASPPPPTPPHKGEGSADAVQDDLLLIVRRVEALAEFLDTEDGASLLTAYRRAANILRIEEKKDGRSYVGQADPARFALDEERVLFDRIAEVAAEADAALAREDFAGAMAALARLRGPVDTFFDEVTVNADEPALRENRLLLLSQIRAAMDRVADFSKIGG